MKTMCILLKWEFHRDEASNNPTLKSISPEKHLQPMMFLFYCTSNGIALRRCKAWCTAGLWVRQCEVRMTLYSDFKLTFKPVSTILKYFSVEEQGTMHLRICQGNKLYFAEIIGGDSHVTFLCQWTTCTHYTAHMYSVYTLTKQECSRVCQKNGNGHHSLVNKHSLWTFAESISGCLLTEFTLDPVCAQHCWVNKTPSPLQQD